MEECPAEISAGHFCIYIRYPGKIVYNTALSEDFAGKQKQDCKKIKQNLEKSSCILKNGVVILETYFNRLKC